MSFILIEDVFFGAELGSYHSLSAKELEIMHDILRPFDSGETAVTKVMMNEFRHLKKVMALSDSQKTWELSDIFWKRNATANRMYTAFKDVVRLGELTPQKFAIEMKKHSDDDRRRIGIPFLYNPAGEMLAVIAKDASWSDIVGKEHDLEGLRRLAWLKVLIHRENVPRTDIQQFLDAHANDFGNPYTGEPMKWDPVSGSIFCTRLSEKRQAELFL